jgi:hypothetical protein
MRGKMFAASVAAGMLALGLVQVPASASARGPTVGETVLKGGTYHKYESAYWSRPGRIALIQPDSREVKDLIWDSWTTTGGISNGTLTDALGNCGCGVPATVQVTRPRNGHFTRMTIFPATSTTPMKFWWPASPKRSSLREWQASATAGLAAVAARFNSSDRNGCHAVNHRPYRKADQRMTEACGRHH